MMMIILVINIILQHLISISYCKPTFYEAPALTFLTHFGRYYKLFDQFDANRTISYLSSNGNEGKKLL